MARGADRARFAGPRHAATRAPRVRPVSPGFERQPALARAPGQRGTARVSCRPRAHRPVSRVPGPSRRAARARPGSGGDPRRHSDPDERHGERRAGGGGVAPRDRAGRTRPPRRGWGSLLGPAGRSAVRFRHVAARPRGGGRHAARGRRTPAAAARGARFRARRDGPHPGPRHDAAAIAQATARDRRTGRSRSDSPRAREQEGLQQRVQELSRAVEEVTRAAQAAGLGDTAFQARLREVQELLRRAVTPELAARLRELQEALARLDPEATRRALERLAEAQQLLKDQLERSQELFRRAAVEGALASLAADAEDLRRRQAEWNRDDAARPDSAGAARQRTLADRADSLARGIERVATDLRAGPRTPLAAPQQAARAAARQSREAAGKHALVSPQLDAALGYAKRQMAAARAQLEEADPNAAEAATLADDAVDALNATALALARSRSQVAGGKSGSGFAEAVEQLARLARDQQGLNGLAQGLLPLMGLSGEAMLQRLQALAARQRALAEQLERLQAEGANAAAGPLAQEAKELARQLEAGRLDQQTIERQQRLYRRLLDAGRTLSNDEPDENKERVSRSATGDSVHIPDILKPGATGAGPRLRYPRWEELQGLTPEQRRLVLEYFRRLNAPQQ